MPDPCNRCGYKTNLTLTMELGMLCPSCLHITGTDPIWVYAESEEEMGIKMKDEANRKMAEDYERHFKGDKK